MFSVFSMCLSIPLLCFLPAVFHFLSQLFVLIEVYILLQPTRYEECGIQVLPFPDPLNLLVSIQNMVSFINSVLLLLVMIFSFEFHSFVLIDRVTEVKTNIYVTSFGPVSDTDMVSLPPHLASSSSHQLRQCSQSVK